jgi:hypothetical protein
LSTRRPLHASGRLFQRFFQLPLQRDGSAAHAVLQERWALRPNVLNRSIDFEEADGLSKAELLLS